MLGLEPLFSWFGDLIDWAVSWLPSRGRLHVHEGGVKVTGESVNILKHGTYWYFPRWSEIFTDNIKRKVIALPEQTVTTQDGVSVRVGGVLIYHIKDIQKWLIENEDPEYAVQIDSCRILRDFVTERAFLNIQSYRPDRRGTDILTKEAQGAVGIEFGIHIRYLGFTSFAKTRALDLHHSREKDGLQGAVEADD